MESNDLAVAPTLSSRIDLNCRINAYRDVRAPGLLKEPAPVPSPSPSLSLCVCMWGHVGAFPGGDFKCPTCFSRREFRSKCTCVSVRDRSADHHFGRHARCVLAACARNKRGTGSGQARRTRMRATALSIYERASPARYAARLSI